MAIKLITGMVGLVQAVAVGAITAGTSAILGAIVGGVFMLCNSVLTIWLTRRIERDAERRTGQILGAAPQSGNPTGPDSPGGHRGDGG